jgi:hypothetical protein
VSEGLRVCALLLPLLAALTTNVAAEEEPSQLKTRPAANALVVLVGRVAQRPELAPLLLEFLERAGVSARAELRTSFELSTLWTDTELNTGVRVFITSSDDDAVRLYFRGPFGQRFLARDLVLSGGLDEVGRETIAVVLETSVLALLHSQVGLDREAAKLVFAPGAPVVTPPRPAVSAPMPDARSANIEYELAARGVCAWTGGGLGAALGFGAELGRSVRSEVVFHRERLAFEYRMEQSLRTPIVTASLAAVVLRGGIDLGARSAAHAAAFGLSIGADVVRITPKHSDPSWRLDSPRTDLVPMVRAELRYELALSTLLLTVAALADISLVDTHYDAQDGPISRRAATPWPVRPGMALTVGGQSALFE